MKSKTIKHNNSNLKYFVIGIVCLFIIEMIFITFS